MSPLILVLILFLAALIAVIIVKTMMFKSRQITVEPIEGIKFDVQKAAEKLSRAIQLKTISQQDPTDVDKSQFIALITLIEESFPEVHTMLERDIVEDRIGS